MDHILHVRTPKIQCFGKTVWYPTYKTSFVNSDVYFFFKIGKKSKYPSLKLANLCIAKFQSTWQFSNLKKMYVWQLIWFTVTESGICSTMFSKLNEYVVQKKKQKGSPTTTIVHTSLAQTVHNIWGLPLPWVCNVSIHSIVS